MDRLFFPILTTVAGAYFLIRNVMLIRNEAKLSAHLQSSPKAKYWLKTYGLEKTIQLSKSYFLPLGLLVAAGLLGVGLWSMTMILAGP